MLGFISKQYLIDESSINWERITKKFNNPEKFSVKDVRKLARIIHVHPNALFNLINNGADEMPPPPVTSRKIPNPSKKPAAKTTAQTTAGAKASASPTKPAKATTAKSPTSGATKPAHKTAKKKDSKGAS